MLILAAGSKRLQPLARRFNYSILYQRVMKTKDALGGHKSAATCLQKANRAHPAAMCACSSL